MLGAEYSSLFKALRFLGFFLLLLFDSIEILGAYNEHKYVGTDIILWINNIKFVGN